MTGTINDSSDPVLNVNIFFFIAQLEKKGMDASKQDKKKILNKLNLQQAQYNNEIAQWKLESDQIGKDSQIAQEDAAQRANFFNSLAGTIVGALILVLGGQAGLFLLGAESDEKIGFFEGPDKTTEDQGRISKDIQEENKAQVKVQKTQQEMSKTLNIELNSQQMAEQTMQNKFNSALQDFGSMGSYNNLRG